MKRPAIFIVIVCLLWTVPSLTGVAQAGVGLTEAVFKDAGRGRTLKAHIWYPSDDKPAERFAENAVFEGIDAVKDGTIRPGEYPLFILLHGTTGNWRNLSWLAARLAANGGVVCAADHPGYTSGDADPASVLRAWDQPLDAGFLAGAMLRSRFKGVIAPGKVFAVGYSLGGYSALALAGARLDLRRYVEFCAGNQDRSSRYFKAALPGLTEQDFATAAQDLRDTRFTAAVAIAPGFVEAFTPESVKSIAIPVLIVGGGKDQNIPPSTHFYPRLPEFPKNVFYREMPGASHFSFMQLCKPGALKILAEEDAEFVCLDYGVDRRAIHDKLYQYIVEFLGRNGD